MDKIKDLLSDLEKKVESNLNELLSLREQNNELLDKNKSLINERNDLMLDLLMKHHHYYCYLLRLQLYWQKVTKIMNQVEIVILKYYII